MPKVYDHIIPKIEHWPIYHLYQNRSDFVKELNNYTFEKFNDKGDQGIFDAISSTIYLEKIRVKSDPWKVDPPNEGQYWKKLEKELSKNSQSPDKDELNRVLLKRIINRYSEEIAGGFVPKTFRWARKILTFFFKRLLNSTAGKRLSMLWGNKHQLYERLLVEGHVEEMRDLMKKGTVIIVPTHFSNLDSIMIGYVLDSIVGVPAFSYGAGLNLYDAELIAYFISRLGAYKLDRRKKNPIYAESLRSFSALTAKKNVNSLFFPGGTRSRSGALEKNVKLGLLGTMIEAQRKLIEEGSDRKIFIVPLVKSYHFVLEGKFLIDGHLKAQGKEKYTKSQSKDTTFKSMIGFLRTMFSEGSEMTFSFGEPMDVFGNIVDTDGNSYDKHKKTVDISTYFYYDGQLTHDKQRENIYTRILGKKIVESFHRNNIVLTSHLVNFVAFRYLLHLNRNSDIYSIVSLPPDEYEIEKGKFEMLVSEAVFQLKELRTKGKVKLSKEFDLSIEDIIAHGIKHSGTYHNAQPIIVKENGNIGSESLRLLYYYHNRMLGYHIENRLSMNEPANYKYSMQID